MISPLYYDECCKEFVLKLIYLTKCITDLTVHPSLKMVSMEIQRRNRSKTHTYIANKY